MSAPAGCLDEITWGVVFRLFAVKMSYNVNANVGSAMMTLLLPLMLVTWRVGFRLLVLRLMTPYEVKMLMLEAG